MPYWYILTIKDNRMKFTSIDELSTAFTQVRESIPKAEYSCNTGYELDCLNRMHFHAIFCVPNRISCRRYNRLLNTQVGMHHHFKQFPYKDLDKVIDYVTKEKSPAVKEEISRHHFLMRALRYKRIV